MTESVTGVGSSLEDGKKVGIAQRPDFEVEKVFESVKQLARFVLRKELTV